jgi:hypothetical protein
MWMTMTRKGGEIDEPTTTETTAGTIKQTTAGMTERATENNAINT